MDPFSLPTLTDERRAWLNTVQAGDLVTECNAQHDGTIGYEISHVIARNDEQIVVNGLPMDKNGEWRLAEDGEPVGETADAWIIPATGDEGRLLQRVLDAAEFVAAERRGISRFHAASSLWTALHASKSARARALLTLERAEARHIKTDDPMTAKVAA